MAKTPKPSPAAEPAPMSPENEAKAAELFAEMEPTEASAAEVKVTLSPGAPPEAVAAAVEAGLLPEPVPSAEDMAPDRSGRIELEMALSRLSSMRVSPIAIAGFDARETQAYRLLDTWENYKARFDAMMKEPG